MSKVEVNGVIKLRIEGRCFEMTLVEAKELLQELKNIFEPTSTVITWPSTGTQMPKYNEWDITCKTD